MKVVIAMAIIGYIAETEADQGLRSAGDKYPQPDRAEILRLCEKLKD